MAIICRTLFFMIVAFLLNACSNTPSPGYVKNTDSIWPYSYIWKAGLFHPEFPHIKSAVLENHWTADPGYLFPISRAEGDLSVAWHTGLAHPVNPHVLSYSVEGYWVPDPGYALVRKSWLSGYYETFEPLMQPENLQTEWRPNTLHPNCPWLVSLDKVDTWSPVSGYKFVSNESFDVVKIIEPEQKTILPFLVLKAVEVVANAKSQPQDGDGTISTFGRVLSGGAAAIARKEAERELDSYLSDESLENPEIHCDYWSTNRKDVEIKPITVS